MKYNYSDITVVLDRSGSMGVLTSEVIGAFNTFVDEQKQVEEEATFTLVQFDDRYEVDCEAINIQEVSHLDETTYVPRGMTALFDAVGKAILSTGKRLSAMAESDRPEKVIFLIQTDGEENASKEFSLSTIKSMIRDQQEVYSWEFVFLGANIDAVSVAADIGIRRDRAMKYANNAAGLSEALCSLSTNLASFRRGKKVDMCYEESDYDAQEKAGV
ncbi:vWA domain-containing protein [Desulfobulbus oligotrophicus]|uniref:VWA domain-containing protein n=1 Tax=Desulfobulbus oligotrophicus TaxID=1909699 RepID=A0A7T6APH5_9BACT|nr:vWA domain-containing protein [Desulfobulbus oligotrophicus]QQG64643.1 VWA domain-containing protein [Desulfobulbus oligotrophicus]